MGKKMPNTCKLRHHMLWIEVVNILFKKEAGFICILLWQQVLTALLNNAQDTN